MQFMGDKPTQKIDSEDVKVLQALARRLREVAALPGVEAVPLLDGRVSLRVRGLEVDRTQDLLVQRKRRLP